MSNLRMLTGCIEELHIDGSKVRLVVNGKAAIYPRKKNFFGSIGDRIALGGKINSNGIFEAIAYKNGSKGTQGTKVETIAIAIGLFFTLLFLWSLMLLGQDTVLDAVLVVLSGGISVMYFVLVLGPGMLLSVLIRFLNRLKVIKKCSADLVRFSLASNGQDQ